MNCDPIARLYRFFEYAVFGTLLERARFHWIARLDGARRVLVLGEGDGRFLAEFALAHPDATIDSIDVSGGMLRLSAARLASRGINCSRRIGLHQADARSDDPPRCDYDLIVTNFFLDCFEEPEAAALAVHLTAFLAPDARWLVSDFRIPAGHALEPQFRLAIWMMYGFFRYTTGLRTRHLADFAGVLTGAGLEREAQARFAGGFVFSEVWRRNRHGAGSEPFRLPE